MKSETLQRKTSILLLIEILIASSLLGLFAPSLGQQPPIDITTYYEGRAVQPKRVDPAVASDNASGELIFNVYQNLIFFSDKPTLPPVTTNVSEWGYSDLSKFEPVLAASMPITSIDRKNWTFIIRSGVAWHDWRAANGSIISGQILTAEDVEYAFKRMLVQDMPVSPSWILNSPLTGYSFWNPLDANPLTNTIEPVGVDGAGERLVRDLINTAITRTSDSVTFHLNESISESAFLQILSITLGCIVNKAFCIEHGCWNGTFYDGWSSDYRRKPSQNYSPLDQYYPDKSQYPPTNPDVPNMCGTGPYKFTYWDRTAGVWRVDNFTSYWGGWGGTHVNASVVRYIPEWSTRYMMLLWGELDSITEPEENTPPSGIVQYYYAPLLSSEAVAYVFHVADDSPFISKINGVPQPYFFNNTHIRKAFAYACGCVPCEGIRPASWWAKGLAPDYENKSLTPYQCNLAAIQAELTAAGVWDSGFETCLVYNFGNELRRIVFEMIRDVIHSLNELRPGLPPFNVNVIVLDWSLYLEEKEMFYFPVFMDGVSADYCDPDNFARPTMYHRGAIAYYQRYNDSYVNQLIDAAYHMSDGQQRNVTYQELQYIYWRDAISSPIAQWVASFWFRDWVRGYYYNPVYPGLYFYDLYKTVVAPAQPVDVSAVSISYPGPVPATLKVTNVSSAGPAGWLMGWIGYFLVTVHIHRVDTNYAVPWVCVIVALNRTNATGYSVIIPRCDAMVVLPIGGEDTEVFLWNESTIAGAYSSKLDPGYYTLSAVVNVISTFAYDNNLANNIVVAAGGPIEVTYLQADFNDDGWVDAMDLTRMGNAWGSTIGDPNYDPLCDINRDGWVDGMDSTILGLNWLYIFH